MKKKLLLSAESNLRNIFQPSKGIKCRNKLKLHTILNLSRISTVRNSAIEIQKELYTLNFIRIIYYLPTKDHWKSISSNSLSIKCVIAGTDTRIIKWQEKCSKTIFLSTRGMINKCKRMLKRSRKVFIIISTTGKLDRKCILLTWT
jgi:hypothetical protein